MFPQLCKCLRIVLAALTFALLSPSFLWAQVPTQTIPAKPDFEEATGTIIDARWASGVPLGGVGVGKIELLTDGSFGNFTNNHNWDRPYGWAKGAFAAVRIQAGNTAPVAKMLRLTSAGEYQNVANIAHTRMQGFFPRAHLAFADPGFPIKVTLNAYSPLIPHNVKDSSLPVACFAYTVANPTAQSVHVSVMLAWPNLLGWGGRAKGPFVKVPVIWDSTTGNQQTPAPTGTLSGLHYTTTQAYPDVQENVVGDYLGVHQEQGVRVTTCPTWDADAATPAFWSGFTQTGDLQPLAETGTSQSPAGAVAAQVTLAPGQSRTLRFFYVWAMPHMRMTQQGVSTDAGHYWQNWFAAAPQIAAYADANDARLSAGTVAWQADLRRSNLPFWLQLKLINCAFPIVTNTVLTRDGRFAIQESPVNMAGATGTMDQRMAAHTFYTVFFPELDRAELELFAHCQQPSGQITHMDGNLYTVIGDPHVLYGITGWPDLSCSWTMQIAQMVRWTGDTAFEHRMMPHVTAAMSWLKADDHDGDAIPEGGSTYDYEHGPMGSFIYTASCYLGALRAASALAAATGDVSQAQAYDARLALVQKSVMSELWNGTFFRKWYMPDSGKSNENSFVSNMAGDWQARLAGLPRTLAPDIIHKSIEQTIARHMKPFFPIPPMEVTPEGRLTTGACYVLQHEPYLGCEAVYENYADDGLDMIHRIYLCVWNLSENPWDESLVYWSPDGHRFGFPYYMTSPTSWNILYALSGASLDLPQGVLYLAPHLPSSLTELHMPFYFPRFWAWLDYVPAQHKMTLRVDRVFPADPTDGGRLYTIPATSKPAAAAPLILTTLARDGDSPRLRLPKPFLVRPGATLDLSPFLGKLVLPARSEEVNFAVRIKTVRQGLPATHWTLTDNLNDTPGLNVGDASAALDGDPTTRWTTNRPMRPGDRLTLDMGAAQTVSKIVLDDAQSPGDGPHGYTVEASTDGQTWQTVAQATEAEAAAANGGVLTIEFAPVSARYLRITNQGAATTTFWSVYELSVFGP